jgi:hypothetical protein
MTKKDMLHRLHEVVNTPDDEVMILPYGNSKPEDVLDWILDLSDEEFNLLMKTPIIVQAKIFYSDFRKKYKKISR